MPPLETLGVEAPDDKTFIVHLSTPGDVLPQRDDAVGDGADPGGVDHIRRMPSRPATTSARARSSSQTWNHNSEIVLTPNPNWYGETKPTLTEIHMSMSPEPAQAMAAYEAGEIDMLLPVPSADIERVKADPVLGPEFAEAPALAIVYYNYNNGTDPSGEGTLARCQDPKACPTTNKDFRIALTQAIDKETFKLATFANTGPRGRHAAHARPPGRRPRLRPVPVRPGCRTGEHGDCPAANSAMPAPPTSRRSASASTPDPATSRASLSSPRRGKRPSGSRPTRSAASSASS